MHIPGRTAGKGQSRGQSLVEFSLVLPLMLLLLITVGDFGRLFASAITIESAARAAAEIAAADYLTEDLRDPAPITAAGYDRIHRAAWQSVCDEASRLPNALPGTGGGECTGLPTVVCVHDEGTPLVPAGSGDPHCGNVYNAAGGIPAQCPTLQAGARPTNTHTGGAENSRYVEVRVCYRFTTIFHLDIPALGRTLTPLAGDFFVERTRMFSVIEY